MHIGTAIFVIFIIVVLIRYPVILLIGLGLGVVVLIAVSSSSHSPPPPPRLTAEQVAEQQRQTEIRERQEQSRWMLVTPAEVSTTSGKLENCYGEYCTNILKLTVRNRSTYSVTGLNVTVRIYNCEGQSKPDYSNCDLVGENSTIAPKFESSDSVIPPGQAREFEATLKFKNVPDLPQGWTRQLSHTVNRVKTRGYEPHVEKINS